MRARSPGISRAAAAGSRRFSSACSAATPSLARRARTCLADFAGNRRHGGKPSGQRIEIEPGAADHDRRPRRAPRLGQHRGGLLAPAADRKVLRRVDMAVEPVRHALFLGRARPRRDNAQVAIDLHRIGVDDHAAELFGKPERQRRFAARRRPGNEDDVSFAHGVDVVPFSAI